jgi:ketosteroid isomerase-like protein
MHGAIGEQVLAANRRFYDALEALDTDAMAACWAHGPEVACLHPGGPWQRGWEDVRDGWQAIMAATDYIEFRLDDAAVTVVDPVAWVTCIERITSAGGSAAPAVAEAAATNVFVLDGSGWHLVLHHSSPVIRPAPTGD